MKTLGLFINGAHTNGNSDRRHDVWNPTTGEVQAQAILASRDDVTAAIDAAEKAFPA